MLYAMELVLSVLVALWAWSTWRRGPAETLLGLGVWAGASLPALPAAWLTVQGLGLLGLPLSTQLAAAALAALSASLAAGGWAHRRLRRGPGCLQERLARRWEARPPWQDRAARGALSATCLGLGLLAAFVAANLASLVAPVGEETLLARHLLVPPTPGSPAASAPGETGDPAGEDDGPGVERLLRPLQDGWERGRDMLAEASGVRSLLEHLQAVQTLVELPDHQRQWLAVHDPHLRSLVDSPTLRAVLEDPALLERMLAAGRGSLTDVQALLDDPKVQALGEDEELLAAARAVDLLELQRLVELRRERGFPAALYWQQALAPAPSAGDVRAALDDPARWRVPAQPGYVLGPPRVLPGAGGCLLGKTALTSYEDQLLDITVRLPPGLAAQLYVDGDPFPLTRSGEGLRGGLPLRRGQQPALLLVVDLRQADAASRGQPVVFEAVTRR